MKYSIYDKKKEHWEFEWQRKNWAPLFSKPENRAKVWQYWNSNRFLDRILNLINIDDATTILDVGCGISTVLHFLPGKLYGIDPLGEI